MIDAIRTAYGYKDEYIMSKTMKWVRNAYDLSVRRKYNENLQLAQMVMHMYAAGMSKEVRPPKSFGEMIKESRYVKKKEKETPRKEFIDDNRLSSLGIAVRKPRKKS